MTSAPVTAAPAAVVVSSEPGDRQAGRTRSEDRKLIVQVGRVALPVLVLLGWEFASGDPATQPGALIDSFYISKSSEIWAALLSWIEEAVLLESVQATVTAMLYGFGIGAVLGVLVGIVLGSSPMLGGIFRPFVVALNAIPRLALVPLFILWFGFGLGSKVALVTVIVFFLVFYAAYEGVRDVEQARRRAQGDEREQADPADEGAGAVRGHLDHPGPAGLGALRAGRRRHGGDRRLRHRHRIPDPALRGQLLHRGRLRRHRRAGRGVGADQRTGHATGEATAAVEAAQPKPGQRTRRSSRATALRPLCTREGCAGAQARRPPSVSLAR